MNTGQEILKQLKAQHNFYLAMKRAVEKQQTHIETRNIGGLTAGTAEVRGLIHKIKDIDVGLRPLRQSWNMLGLDRVPAVKREIDALIDAIRNHISDIQGIKEENTLLLKEQMGGLRKEMTGLNARSQAARAYQGQPGRRPARFIDKSN
ncbi:MAG: hypothetical protein O2954_10350 [bacterium]|nr:hypothetical protein [bacterium]